MAAAQPQPTETREEKIANLEYELQLFEDFVKSPIWSLMRTQWQPIIDSTIGAALAYKTEDRGFVAGKVNGLRSFMKYPEQHVKNLQVRLKTLRGSSQA